MALEARPCHHHLRKLGKSYDLSGPAFSCAIFFFLSVLTSSLCYRDCMSHYMGMLRSAPGPQQASRNCSWLVVFLHVFSCDFLSLATFLLLLLPRYSLHVLTLMGQLSQEGLTISFRAFLHQCPHYFCIATNYFLVFLFPASLMFVPSHIFPNQRFSNIICQMNE